MLTVSLSAYQSWQRCEQRYFYSYVRRLRQKVMDLAPERGVLLHEYLAGYYRMLQAGASAEDSHTESLATLSEEQRPKLSASANISFFAGDEELAAQYMELMDVVERIAERYYIARGRGDAERYDVLLVEERIRIELLTEVFSVSVIDLVLRDRISSIRKGAQNANGRAIVSALCRCNPVFQRISVCRAPQCDRNEDENE